jgi:hypothetical protein
VVQAESYRQEVDKARLELTNVYRDKSKVRSTSWGAAHALLGREQQDRQGTPIPMMFVAPAPESYCGWGVYVLPAACVDSRKEPLRCCHAAALQDLSVADSKPPGGSQQPGS